MSSPNAIQDQHVRTTHLLRNSLLAIALMIVITLLLGYLLVRRSLSIAMQQAQALGPTTLQDLEAKRRSWPPDQDADPAFQKICDVFAQEEKSRTPQEKEFLKQIPLLGEAEDQPLGHLWPRETQEAVATYLQSKSPALTQLDGLRKYPGGRHPLTLTANPLDMFQMPELVHVRTAVKLECLVIKNGAMTGHVNDLPDRLQVMSRVRSLIEDQPTLISALVVAASDALLCATLEQAMAMDAIRPDDLEYARRELANRAPYDSLKCALLGERATFITVGQSVQNGRALPGVSMISHARIPLLNAIFMKDVAFGIGLFNRLIAAMDDPMKLEAAAKAVDLDKQKTPAWAILTSIMMPSIQRAIQLIINSEAELRVAQVGLAVEHFRLDHGQFPRELSELVPRYLPKLPIDPFDLKPLRYKHTSEGIQVYSVGINNRDDAGVMPDQKNMDDADTVFTVLSPDRRRQPPVSSDSQPSSAPVR